MDFIKQHYEKVILLGLFVLFIGLMIVVRGVISSTEEVKESDLKLKAPVADHVNEDEKDAKFDAEKRWNDSNFRWDKAKSAGENIPASDLVSTYKMAACPFCSKKDKPVLIPLAVFKLEDKAARKCPECDHQLEKPLEIDVVAEEEKFYAKDEKARLHEEEAKVIEEYGKTIRAEYDEESKMMEEFAANYYRVELEKLRQEEEARRREEERDKDGDGIDDEQEREYGMDGNDKDDIYYDTDGDGFSNIFEIENGTKPNDAKSHPELWWRLRVKSVAEIELREQFKALTAESDDKSSWQAQFNYRDENRGNREFSRFLMIGDTIEIDKRKYRLVDIEKIIDMRREQAGNLDERGKDVFKPVDKSKVTLVEVDPANGAQPDKLVMTVGQPAKSNDRRPVLEDTGNLGRKKRERPLRIGDTVTLGLFSTGNNNEQNSLSPKARRAQIRTYKLVAVDAESMSVTLEEMPSGNDNKKAAAAKKDQKPAESKRIVITKDGKVPKDRLPRKKVEKSPDADHDGMD